MLQEGLKRALSIFEGFRAFEFGGSAPSSSTLLVVVWLIALKFYDPSMEVMYSPGELGGPIT